MSQTDESSSITAKPEHEVFTFLRIDQRLRALPSTEKGYKVHTNTDLTGALDKLAGSPFTSFALRYVRYDFRIVIKGEEAGTWQYPDVSVFQKYASPSQFGSDEETIMDPTYRRGTELKASDLNFLSSKEGSKEDVGEHIIKYIQDELAPAMFIGKKLRIKLYKLAICGEGGHFDWHRNSTHSDAHHGTVLFALNTEWEGGELMLRHQGVEANLDMHPASLAGYKNGLRPVVIAFYADTEHKVMPVTKGVRLVLQYDVEVVGEQPPADEYDPLERVTIRNSRLKSFTTYPNLDLKLIQGVIKEIKKLHEQGTNIVAFPLSHLYRVASVKMEYLKGTDSVLFDALNDQFDTSINPVVIHYTYEGEYLGGQDCIAYIYTAKKKEDPDSKHKSYDYYDRDGNVVEGASFHLPVASAIQKLSEVPYIEGVGNEEPQMGDTMCYGAGIFVKPKNKRSSSVHKSEKGDESKEVKKRQLE